LLCYLYRILSFISICFLIGISHSYGQIENFEIDYPFKGSLSKFQKDEQGYIWFYDDKDYYQYNGHQITALGLDKIINIEKDDYLLLGEIIFVQDSILFLNENKISLIHPSTKEVKDLWQLPNRNYFKYLYQDELDNIWVFASTWDNQKQPVYKSTDGKEFVEMFDLNDYVDDQGVFWTYYELNDKDGDLYFLWRLGGMTIISSEGKEVELDILDKKAFSETKDCSQFRLDNKKNLWRIYNKDFQIFNWEKRIFESHILSGKIEFTTNCKIKAENENQRIGLPDVESAIIAPR